VPIVAGYEYWKVRCAVGDGKYAYSDDAFVYPKTTRAATKQEVRDGRATTCRGNRPREQGAPKPTSDGPFHIVPVGY
jgi:hypothetical protein